MHSIPQEHRQTVSAFLGKYFGSIPAAANASDSVEGQTAGQILNFVSERIGSSKYVLGLALDFALLAQQLSEADAAARTARPGFDEKQIFKRYRLIEVRGTKQANTLTVVYREQQFGIRKLEESVARLFVELNRPSYPSAYVYNTGQWRKYVDTLLVPCFQLSEAGRYHLCLDLIGLGMKSLSAGTTVPHSGDRARVFDLVLASYPRSCRNENAGMALQGMAYGFFHADRPHLSLVVDKSRTGSARQRRTGDIDGYLGQSLELCVEVKDHDFRDGQIESEFGEYMSRLAQLGAQGIAIVGSADAASRKALAQRGIRVLAVSDMSEIVALWDWHKQESALQGLLHFVANVEQNPAAVRRLQEFMRTVGSDRRLASDQ